MLALLFRSRTRPAPARRRPDAATAQLRVEGLEDRTVCNASSVFDSLGNLNTYIVHRDGTMTLTNKKGTKPVDLRPGSLVRVAHAYLDAKHKVSVDVVYQDGKAFEYDSTGEHLIDVNVLDMAHVIGAKGAFKLDILYSNAGTYSPAFDQPGTLKETTKAGTTTLGTNIRWVNNFLDAKGKPGIYMGVFDVGGNLIVTRTDSVGTTTLYNSPDGATEDLTDVSETRKGSTVVIDMTSGRFAGSYALEFSPKGVVLLGNGQDIASGG